VEVDGDDVVGTGDLEHVCQQLGRDGGTALVLLVLAGVGKVWQHQRDATGASGAAGVAHDEHLHDAVVDLAGRRAGNDKDVLITNRLANGNTRLLV
jgi:hypothetical protein